METSSWFQIKPSVPPGFRIRAASALAAAWSTQCQACATVTRSTLEQIEATAHGDHRSSRKIALFGALNTSTEFERYVVAQTLSTALRDGADENRVAATFRNGVLEITIPVSEREQGRKVQVQSSAS